MHLIYYILINKIKFLKIIIKDNRLLMACFDSSFDYWSFLFFCTKLTQIPKKEQNSSSNLILSSVCLLIEVEFPLSKSHLC